MKTRYVCDTCGRVFDDETTCRRHEKEHDDTKVAVRTLWMWVVHEPVNGGPRIVLSGLRWWDRRDPMLQHLMEPLEDLLDWRGCGDVYIHFKSGQENAALLKLKKHVRAGVERTLTKWQHALDHLDGWFDEFLEKWTRGEIK